MTDDFGILPMPKKNAQQPSYLNLAEQHYPIIGIPKNNRQLEQTGIIMEALAARFARVREQQISDFENIYLRSDDDIEMLEKYIIGSIKLDVGFVMRFSGMPFDVSLEILDNFLGYGPGNFYFNDFASEIQSRIGPIETEINDFMSRR